MTVSVVTKRLESFVGKTVTIRKSWSPATLETGVLVATYPLGRDHFVELLIDGCRRLFQTRALLEICELAATRGA